MDKVEKSVFSVGADEVLILRGSTRTPSSPGDTADFNNGGMTLHLKLWEERDVSTQQVISAINAKLRDIPGVSGLATAPSALGRGRGQPLNSSEERRVGKE